MTPPAASKEGAMSAQTMDPVEPRRSFAVIGSGSLWDGVAYWATLAGVFLLLLASLARLEFLPHRDKSLLQVGLAVALVTFACLAFGQTATGQHEGSASLYQYFGATVVILLLVSLLPPNRAD